MEIDPHLRQLQEQAKMFSRFNSTTDPQPEPEEKEPRKQFLIFHIFFSPWIRTYVREVNKLVSYFIIINTYDKNWLMFKLCK